MEAELAAQKLSPITDDESDSKDQVEKVTVSYDKTKAMKEIRPTAVKAPAFKGTASEDFLVWLQNYDQICKINGWSEEFKTIYIASVLQ